MSKKIKKAKRAFSVRSGLHFVVYVDTSGGYRWNLLARNGKIIADSAESYKKESDARAMIALIIGASKFAKISATKTPVTTVVTVAPVEVTVTPVVPPAVPTPGVPFVDRPFTGNPGPG